MPERERAQTETAPGIEGCGPLPERVRAALRHRRRVRRARVGAALASVAFVALLSVVLSSTGGARPDGEYGPVRLDFDDPMLAALDAGASGRGGVEREWSVGMVYRGDWPGGL
ncbi:MAG: hypothetical protein ACF8Q5_09915 [Phycisphaerales bacterium JB040]